ncbi:MAG TPA: hypothetical protein VNK43_02110 [Gemmatimonadales bacterium]|jgi:hypothetical protein|nr:hypothetical protein [Gemmatimonadales bacterium]
MRHHHSLFREAADAGCLGALAVFLWFLLWDALAGHPLHTPNVLGQLLLYGSPTAEPGLGFFAIMAYTAVHFILFLLLALVIVGLVHQAIRHPALLVALLIAFAMFELLFLGLAYALVEGVSAAGLSWWSFVVGNVIAVLVIGVYLNRGHRIIARYLARVPLGDTGDEPEVKTPEAWHAMGRWRHPWWERLLGMRR